LNGRKARAGAANSKVHNAILHTVQRENAPCFYESRAATKARIARAVNEALDFSVALKAVWMYSRHVGSFFNQSVSKNKGRRVRRSRGLYTFHVATGCCDSVSGATVRVR